VPKGQQDHGCVTMAPAVVLGRLNQPLDLALGQVLTGPRLNIRMSLSFPSLETDSMSN